MRRLALIALVLAGCARRPAPAPGEGVVAVAFRDAVPDWQRVGTRGFSVHYLEQGYDQVTYLEADALGAEAPAVLEHALADALRKNRAVDLFLLVNGGDSTGVVARLSPELRSKLRLVYNTGASGGAQGASWMELGARAYVSHPGWANLAPFFYVDFLRDWIDGEPLDDAVGHANRALHQRLTGFSAPFILRASGFRAAADDLPYWERATHAELRGDASFAIR